MFTNLLITILITSSILTGNINSGEVLGVQTQTAGDNVVEQKPLRINPQNLNVQISASSGIAIDLNSEKILFAKNIHAQRPIASITKLMTILTFLDTQQNLEKIIEVLPEDLNGESKKNLYVNEKITLKNLLHIALIESDNNATKLLVKHSGFNLEEFIKKMNTKAKGMGLINTSFEGITGLSENNISTAYEVAQILKTASKHSLIKQILPLTKYNFKSVSGQSHYLKNTNQLLNNSSFDWDLLIGKTGYTNEAGNCLASLVSLKNNAKIITVILNAPQNQDRFDDTKCVVEWTKNNYQW